MRALLERCLLCGLVAFVAVLSAGCGKGRIPKPPSSPPRPVTYLALSLSVVVEDVPEVPEVPLLDEPLALF